MLHAINTVGAQAQRRMTVLRHTRTIRQWSEVGGHLRKSTFRLPTAALHFSDPRVVVLHVLWNRTDQTATRNASMVFCRHSLEYAHPSHWRGASVDPCGSVLTKQTIMWVERCSARRNLRGVRGWFLPGIPADSSTTESGSRNMTLL